MIKVSVLSFSKNFPEVWSFLCTWSLERCLRMWFYELTGVFVGFDVADPIEELKLSLMRLWRYTGNFSGHTNSERRRRSQRAPRVWKRKRETFILRSAQLLRGTGDYRWIFHDRKDYALEFFALYLSDSLCTLHATQTKSATVLNTEISFSHTYAKGAKMTKCHDGF